MERQENNRDLLSDGFLDSEESLEILEVTEAALTFLGIKDKFKEPNVRMMDKDNCAQVILETQYDCDLNKQTYRLSTDIHFDHEIVDSICVSESWGSYDGYVDMVFSYLFVGSFDEVSKNTYFKKTNDGQLEVTSIVNEKCGHTDYGVDKFTESTTTEVYEFDGDWKNLSPDMKKVGQVREKAKNKI